MSGSMRRRTLGKYKYGYEKVHGLNKEVLVQLLYRAKNL